jgi:hypothetical protein
MDLMHGDKFESENIDWLHSKLPYYEKIWVDYIGHDGQGNPIPPENLDEIEIINWRKYLAIGDIVITSPAASGTCY